MSESLEFQLLEFTRNWESSEDFSTYEANEAQVRKDMQFLHNETKNFINESLIPQIKQSNADITARAEEAAARAEEAAEHAVEIAGGDFVTKSDFQKEINNLTAASLNAVPVTRTINGKPLTDNIELTATDIGVVANVFHVGSTAPADTAILWIDPTGGLKYYNGSAWVVVPVAYAE